MDEKIIYEACRVCQTVGDISVMHYLLDEDLQEKFETICAVDVTDEDELVFLCNDCKTTIKGSYRLRQLAQRTSDNQTSNKISVMSKEIKKDETENDHSVKPHLQSESTVIKDELDSKYELVEILHNENELEKDLCIIYNCSYCSYTFPNYEQLKDHVKFCISEKPSEKTQCYECLKNIKTIYLDDHLSKCKGKKAKHSCPFEDCTKIFVRKISLNVHITSTHYGEKQYQCDFCEKRFSTKDILRNHISSHTNVRREECFICGAKFKTRLGLYKHKARHSDVYFHCNYCTCKFKDKYERDYHERIKHLGQKVIKRVINDLFPCPECGFEYKTKTTLMRHIIRIHKNVKDYVCMACPAKYGFHNSLKKHILRKHPEIDLNGIQLLPDPHAEIKQLEENSKLTEVQEILL